MCPRHLHFDCYHHILVFQSDSLWTNFFTSRQNSAHQIHGKQYTILTVPKLFEPLQRRLIMDKLTDSVTGTKADFCHLKTVPISETSWQFMQMLFSKPL